jgi:hypothetical protein
MSVGQGRWGLLAMVVLAALALMPGRAAYAYTLAEAHQIFDLLDTSHNGKVTKLEFEANKVDAFYFRNRKNDEDPRLRFEDTGLSRDFFDRADEGHKGYLTGLDLIDAIHFEDIDLKHRGFFDFQDFVAALKTISR